MGPKEICSRVVNYYRAYYAELREQVGSHESTPEAIPDFLRQDYKRRIVVDICRDGVIIGHYADHNLPTNAPEFFECYPGHYHQGVRVKDLEPGWNYKPGSRWFVIMANFRVYKGPDTTGPMVWKAPWKRRDAVSDVIVSE